jgi:cytochrome c oxidase cbb3-type subunit I/II
VAFGINMFGTIFKRRERHLYVAIWFYIATFVTIAVLHIVNSFRAAGITIQKLYGLRRCAGCIGAMVVRSQRSGILPHHALFGYDVLLPAQNGQPPHLFVQTEHTALLGTDIYLHMGRSAPFIYTTLPGWAQSLGVAFSIMLIAPSWGGMINGLLTLRGAWDKVREGCSAEVYGGWLNRLWYGHI